MSNSDSRPKRNGTQKVHISGSSIATAVLGITPTVSSTVAAAVAVPVKVAFRHANRTAATVAVGRTVAAPVVLLVACSRSCLED